MKFEWQHITEIVKHITEGTMKKSTLLSLISVTLIGRACAQSADQIKSTEDELTRVYQEARSKMNSSQKDQLKQDEIQWIKKRDADEAKSNNPQETHLKLTSERITELQKLALKQKNNNISDRKDFYSPSDKFPKDPKGIKLIGHFIVDTFQNDGSHFLKADSSSGEKDVNRRFIPKNFNAAMGSLITFTEDFPLFIASDSILGQYNVIIHQQNSPTAQVPTAQVPTAQVPTTQVPTAQVPTAQVPTAQVPTAQVPTAQVAEPTIVADPNATRFKGLYIGMPYQDAVRVAYSIPLKNKLRTLGEATKLPELNNINRALGNSDCDITGDISIHFENNVIASIIFEPCVFNADDMQLDDFCKDFMHAYNIEELKPFYTSSSDNSLFPSMQKCIEMTGDDHGFKYTSPQGFELTINSRKVVTINAVPKKSDRSFN